jgi:hypothetical protein
MLERVLLLLGFLGAVSLGQDVEPTIFFQQDPPMRLQEVRDHSEVGLGLGERIVLHDYSMGVNPEGLFTINLQQHEMLSVNEEGKMRMNADLYVHNLNVDNNLMVGGISQWRLVRADVFSDKAVPTKWAFDDRLNCRSLSMLTSSKSKTISYTYSDLPAHTQVRFEAVAHFVDDWQGETAYMKIDGEYIWTYSNHGPSLNPINLCGSPLYGENAFSIPIDVSIWNPTSTLKVEFGSNLDDGVTAYFGVSSITLSIREQVKASSAKNGTASAVDIDPAYQRPDGSDLNPFANDLPPNTTNSKN